MRNPILIVCALALFGVSAAFAQVVPMQQGDLPPGAIPAAQARSHAGQSITACGLGSYPVGSLNGIDLGNPGNGGTVGADLIMILPSDLNPGMYLGKRACVTGTVELKTFLGSQVPAITAQSARDVSVY